MQSTFSVPQSVKKVQYIMFANAILYAIWGVVSLILAPYIIVFEYSVESPHLKSITRRGDIIITAIIAAVIALVVWSFLS